MNKICQKLMLTHNKCHKLYLGDKFNLTCRFDNKLVKIVKKKPASKRKSVTKGKHYTRHKIPR